MLTLQLHLFMRGQHDLEKYKITLQMDNESIFFFTKWITLSPDLHQNIPHTSCSELIENSTLGGSGENTPHAHTASYHHTTTTMPDCCSICVSLSSLSPESSSDSSEHLSRHFVDHPGVSVLFFLSRVLNFLWDPYFFPKVSFCLLVYELWPELSHMRPDLLQFFSENSRW